TMHRRENHGEGIRNICEAINRIVQDTKVPVIFPVHLNPNVKDVVHDLLGNNPLIRLVAPFAYPEFLWLLNHARLILTDSGGVQEEAPSLGKPVLVTREVTERTEALEAGAVELVGTETWKIVDRAALLLSDAEAYTARQVASNPYGDGQAAERIVELMLSDISRRSETPVLRLAA
ncbi:MAG TPA: UDP-N-acetylglucosamine 2-epimerase, partial [Pirellulales bacterium]|nr:UDP-N-acetylglucosamine 2-epimerase [Pirellulales bacterium]